MQEKLQRLSSNPSGSWKVYSNQETSKQIYPLHIAAGGYCHVSLSTSGRRQMMKMRTLDRTLVREDRHNWVDGRAMNMVWE